MKVSQHKSNVDVDEMILRMKQEQQFSGEKSEIVSLSEGGSGSMVQRNTQLHKAPPTHLSRFQSVRVLSKLFSHQPPMWIAAPGFRGKNRGHSSLW